MLSSSTNQFVVRHEACNPCTAPTLIYIYIYFCVLRKKQGDLLFIGLVSAKAFSAQAIVEVRTERHAYIHMHVIIDLTEKEKENPQKLR